jgi:hypothetical protein
MFSTYTKSQSSSAQESNKTKGTYDVLAIIYHATGQGCLGRAMKNTQIWPDAASLAEDVATNFIEEVSQVRPHISCPLGKCFECGHILDLDALRFYLGSRVIAIEVQVVAL